MKKIILLGIGVIMLFGAWYYTRHPLGEKVVINGHTINVEVVVTEADKQKGLGDRDALAADAGMLFVYQNKDRYGFWMQGMRFPLDFIWIDGNVIVDLSQNIPAPAAPDARPVELAPKVPVDKILEVNAGVIARTGVKIGDIVSFSD